MPEMVPTQRQLLDRLTAIEEEDDDRLDPLQSRRLHQHKEEWFADAFNFLISLSKEDHIWCGSWEIMGPLLETFYNYFKDEHHDSPLKLLWKRISEEMRHCVQCISQHHQAQEMYSTEYELSSIGPLLDVLRSLDEERVTQHLIEINKRISRNEYNATCDNAEVVTMMYEVLMFPILLDDQSLFTEFGKFIEAVDTMHELALAGQQHFPGVYALFFFNRRVRSIGQRFATSMGKLRSSTGLEPLQPLLKKFICVLETEDQSLSETLRPRLQLDRISVWLGIKSLLGFLEPPAFEEGILERYPIFLDIILNHISGDSLEFSHAVMCLRLLFEMLGCKVWLSSTLSPSAMSNTLLGQCFHTRNEKNHKDIFDIFQPFLQSLEALQDGEHEKQRRHFLYFLLHQVPISSNFSILTRKRGCQIALQIVHRGYKMNPPCPPFKCAHMWGPSLVSSLKDCSLHGSLRQPAFDLIQSILISDAAALIQSMLDCCTPSIDSSMCRKFHEDEDDDMLIFAFGAEEKDHSCWTEFRAQSKITSLEYKEWICIPMLWIDVLLDIDPSVMPVSFSKAVFWARSRFSMVEPEISSESSLPVRTWLSYSSIEISSLLGWKIPTGSNDGGDGKESRNSMKVCKMLLPLARVFNRLTSHFLAQFGQGVLRNQWTWHPQMGESLILSLFDPNDNVRQFGKSMLEQISNTRGLACGLKFLCSCASSLFAVYLGLRHALKLVQLNSTLIKFQFLHHFFFVLRKLLLEGDLPSLDAAKDSPNPANSSKISFRGGFLRPPFSEILPLNVDGQSSEVDSVLLQKFGYLLSEAAWPFVWRCLVEGKAFFDYSLCQMTCVRLLEVLPVAFERLCQSFIKQSGSSGMMEQNRYCLMWLHDLMDWRKSPLDVIVAYWKRTVTSLLNQLKESCSDTGALAINAIESLISCDSTAVEEFREQLSRLAVSLSKEDSHKIKRINLGSEPIVTDRKYSTIKTKSFSMVDYDEQILSLGMAADKEDRDKVIVLSDDESEQRILTVDCMIDSKNVAPCGGDESALQDDILEHKVPVIDASKIEAFLQKDANNSSVKQNLQKLNDVAPTSLLTPKDQDGKRKEIYSKSIINDSFPLQNRTDLKVSSNEAIVSKKGDQGTKNVVSKGDDALLKKIVCNTVDDPLENAINSMRCQQSNIAKSNTFAPKRQVIQLKLPAENRGGHLHRIEAGARRFRPPRLDVWYRSILEIDYYAMVGLASAREDESKTVRELKVVPVCFQSPEHYVEIFRPLILEEFKAQLHSSFLEMSSWEEMYICILSVLSVERVDDFHLVRFAYDDNNSISNFFLENDLVLLTKEQPQKTSCDVHMVGKVDRRERDNQRRLSIVLLRFYLINGSSRLHQARRSLTERSKWHASRIMSITPQLREFQALSSVKDIPILPVILNPVSDSISHDEPKNGDLGMLSQPLQQVLKSAFNSGQLQAIGAAIGALNMSKDLQLSLIQGPPGTGKTQTIVAIVSGLLASPFHRTNHTNSSRHGSLKQNNVSRPNSISHTAAIARVWQDAALARQVGEDEKGTKSTDSGTRGRVLICAQSNAAVDELVSRISSLGLYGSDGNMYKPYLVRVGNAKTVHPNSLPFFIDTLVDQRLAEERMSSSDAKNDLSAGSSMTLRSSLEKLVDRIRFYEAKRANLRDGSPNLKNSGEDGTQKVDGGKEMSDVDMESKLRKLYEQKKHIYKGLSAAQAREKKKYEETKALKHKVRKSILRETEVVVTTLSGCGGDLYGVCAESISSYKFGSPSEHTLFDAVVIDEAAQALEPATLIPLQLLKSNGTKCIMVGDPKQLPATVLSNIASKFLYKCSMFERLQRAGHPVIMLKKQYRMHPEICRFPSSHFYNRKLLNGVQMSCKEASFHKTKGLGPYVFYDIVDGKELCDKNSGALSLCNEHESDAAVELVRFFMKGYPDEFSGGRIGVITPYKCQLSLLRSRFLRAFGASVIADLEFNTVDGFQGREVDILILSTVRAADLSSISGVNSGKIGFVADVRRMNVALTRARLSIWILGNARTLQTNPDWNALVKDAKERSLIISVKRPYVSNFRTAAFENSESCNDAYSSQSKGVKNGKDASWHARQGKKTVKKAFDSKEKEIHSVAQSTRTVNGAGKTYSATRKEIFSGKRSSRNELDFSVDKDPSSFVTVDVDVHDSVDINPNLGKEMERLTMENMTSKNVYSPNVGNPDREHKARESEESKPHLLSADRGKKKAKHGKSRTDSYHNEGETDDNKQRSMSQVVKMPKKSSKPDRSQRNVEASTHSMEQCFSERDTNNGVDASTRVISSEALIAKRKRQREAVDAILCSSLIPTKKSETKSIKPILAKRPISTSSVTGCLKPPKTRKS